MLSNTSSILLVFFGSLTFDPHFRHRGGGGEGLVTSWNAILECNKHWVLRWANMRLWSSLKPRNETNRAELNRTESGKSRKQKQQQPQTDSFIKGVCLCECACQCVSVGGGGGLEFVCVGKLFNFFCNFPFHFVLPWRWLWLWSWSWSCSWSCCVGNVCGKYTNEPYLSYIF